MSTSSPQPPRPILPAPLPTGASVSQTQIFEDAVAKIIADLQVTSPLTPQNLFDVVTQAAAIAVAIPSITTASLEPILAAVMSSLILSQSATLGASATVLSSLVSTYLPAIIDQLPPVESEIESTCQSCWSYLCGCCSSRAVSASTSAAVGPTVNPSAASNPVPHA